MPRCKVAFAVALALALVLGPRAAEACGSSMAKWITITDVLPRSGVVPVDGGLVLTGADWGEPGWIGGVQVFWLAITKLEVRDPAGTLIPGELTMLGGEPLALQWRATQPLRPGAVYALRVRANETGRRAEATGFTAIDTTFVAEPVATRAPLAATGGLRARLEPYDIDLGSPTESFCGGCSMIACQPGKTRRSVRVRLTLPVITGGYAPDGYPIDVVGAIGVPPVRTIEPHVRTWGIVRVPAGVERTIALPLPADPRRAAGAPCFSAQVYDLAGQKVDVAPVCLTDAEVAEARALIEANPPEAPPPPGESGNASAFGCSVASGRTSPPIALFAVMLFVLSRRRRPPCA